MFDRQHRPVNSIAGSLVGLVEASPHSHSFVFVPAGKNPEKSRRLAQNVHNTRDIDNFSDCTEANK
jgi:hypothetical protein